ITFTWQKARHSKRLFLRKSRSHRRKSRPRWRVPLLSLLQCRCERAVRHRVLKQVLLRAVRQAARQARSGATDNVKTASLSSATPATAAAAEICARSISHAPADPAAVHRRLFKLRSLRKLLLGWRELLRRHV